jgi:SpoVK/Ycf46/Vps4 family AAA+-type ATPase
MTTELYILHVFIFMLLGFALLGCHHFLSKYRDRLREEVQAKKDKENKKENKTMKKPIVVNLTGAPGAGKTEYAKSLIKKAGQKMSIYNNELEIDNENSKKALPRLNCYLSLKKDDSVLVVDEAETILQTKEFGFFGMELSSSQKGTVNKMLENSENKVIWIVNYTNEMDESTLRRFNYSIKFQQMPKEPLRSIAASKLKSLQIPSSLKNEILDMCSKYKVTGASVDYVVKTINSFEYQQGKDDVIRSQIKSVLEANSSLLNGKKKMRDVVKKSYDLSILNTSIPANDMVDMLRNAEEYKKENLTIENNDGVRMLFYGLSGTGKTELARYISQTLEKPLLLKRCSDLLGSYVGQTEQQIRAAFEEAENTNSILLFDEADSFFADRTTANQSWERTQVNEFLTQMEEFSGICICTTNLRQIMDPAMQRRFHIISEFKALEKSGIQVLLEKYFSNYEFSDSQIRYLASYDSVTPGDFGSLSGKIRFIPKEKISSEYIINELVRIQEEKSGKLSRKIGFAS